MADAEMDDEADVKADVKVDQILSHEQGSIALQLALSCEARVFFAQVRLPARRCVPPLVCHSPPIFALFNSLSCSDGSRALGSGQ